MTNDRIAAEVKWLKDSVDRLLRKVIDVEADLHNRARAGEAESLRQDVQHDTENLLARVLKLEGAEHSEIVISALELWIETEMQREMNPERADCIAQAKALLQQLGGSRK